LSPTSARPQTAAIDRAIAVFDQFGQQSNDFSGSGIGTRAPSRQSWRVAGSRRTLRNRKVIDGTASA